MDDQCASYAGKAMNMPRAEADWQRSGRCWRRMLVKSQNNGKKVGLGISGYCAMSPRGKSAGLKV